MQGYNLDYNTIRNMTLTLFDFTFNLPRCKGHLKLCMLIYKYDIIIIIIIS